jgi:hypothetical protein
MNACHRLRRSPARAIALLPLLLGVAGCGSSFSEAAGRITYLGKPVVCGSVIFVGPDGMTKVFNINADGTYVARGIGTGRAQVGVISQDPARPLDPLRAEKTHGKEVSEPASDVDRDPNAGRVIKNPPDDRSNWAEPTVDRTKWFPLPQKYEMVHTSGLATDLKPGQNKNVDFDLQ